MVDIREAIDLAKRFALKPQGESYPEKSLGAAYATLIDLAEQYLKCQGVMPEKSKEVPSIPKGHLEFCGCGACTFTKELKKNNALIDQCTLAMMKRLEGIEVNQTVTNRNGLNKYNI